jgi:dipeptidyl aminopeptidase/acylaminoacyl peptidase
MRYACFALLLFFPALLFAQNGSEKITVTDLAKLKTVQSVAVSPDGEHAVYAVQSLEPHETDKFDYEYRTHLWLTDFEHPPRQLTRGKESVGRGVWLTNKTLVFTRTLKDKPQLFLLTLDGGEPAQLTDWKYGASNPQATADGSRVVFSVSLPLGELVKDSVFNPKKTLPAWSLEKPGFADNSFLQPNKDVKPNPDGSLPEVRAYLAKDEEDKKAKVIDRLNFQGEATTQPELNVSLLAVIDAYEGAKPRVLTTGFQSYGGATWAPDGKHLYVTTALDEEKHPDRELDAGIAILRLNDQGGLESSYALAGLQRKGSHMGSPAPSPDGKWLAWLSTPSEGVNVPKLAYAEINLKGTIPTVRGLRELDIDRAATNLTWSRDSRYVYYTAPSNGGFPLYRFDVRSGKTERLTEFDSGVGDFDLTKNGVVFAKTEVTNPSELYTASLTAKNQNRVSSHNVDWLKTKQLSFPEKYVLANEKGQTIEYWIMKPTGLGAGTATPSKKYPLLLNMHGGPTAMWGPGEATMWHEFQFFCAKGYGIVYANPRGSGGYGQEFQRANIKDWGTGPAADVLAAATTAAREPWVDTSRQVITGGSYAGYLTAWIVGHDHRFKAAFAQRGVYDLTTFLGEGNAWRLIPAYFQYPWLDQRERVLDRESPYTYAPNIRTPLLIKHGENDLRTGVIGSEMLYKSLKILGKPVEYVRMPGATHELSRSGNPRQRIDRLLRIYEFFERYVGPKGDVR